MNVYYVRLYSMRLNIKARFIVSATDLDDAQGRAELQVSGDWRCESVSIVYGVRADYAICQEIT